MDRAPTRPHRVAAGGRLAVRVTAIYLLAGFAWIVFTDHLLELLGLPPEGTLVAQTLKGTLFVLLSAGLIYWLLRREEAELTRARHALVEARQRQSAIFESALEGILITDSEGRLVEANPEAARIYGRQTDELLGLRVFDLTDRREDGEALHQRLLEEGSQRDGVTFTRADGSRGRIEYAARAEFVPGYNLTLIRDVTDRFEAERAVRESERTYRLLFEHHPHPALVFDPASLRLLAVNQQMVETYGYSRPQLLEMTLRDLRPPAEYSHLDRVLAEELGPHARHAAKHSAKHRTREGRTLDVEIATQAIEFQGRPARIVVITDRTEEHHLREQLHHSQRLESLGRLAGGVAHDFNNLLTVISGFSELLAHHLEGDETGRSQVEQIREAAGRAARLTDQLLAFGRRQVMRPKVIDLNRVVEDLETMLRRVLGEHIELVTRLAPEPPWVRADPGQIEQILVNLVVNAGDAMAGGGCLTLSTGQTDLTGAEAREVALDGEGRFAAVTVQDTGHGIPAESLERIFEPFFTTKEPGKGSGLGLATAYGIARQSGGSLTVESTPGEGSTFRLLLPCIGNATPDTPAVQPPVEELQGRERVLVVEDQEQVRGLIVRALKHWGYEVHATGDADAAREVMARQAETIDLLITDIGLPGERGPELVRTLRAERPRLPVLFISGHPTGGDGPERDLQLEPLLQKPFTPIELARRVREILDRDRTGLLLVFATLLCGLAG